MEEIDIKDILNIFWNKKLHIIVIVTIFIAIGAIYTIAFVKPEYKAGVKLVLVKDTTNNTEIETITQTDISINSKLVSTYSELVKTSNVLSTVIENLGIDISESELKKCITVSSVKDTELIQITVVNINPEVATKIANEIASVFSEKVAKEIYKINNVYIAEEATVPTTPYNVNHIRDIALFALIGILVASAYVIIVNMFDTTLKTQEDIERVTKLTVLAAIPECQEDLKGGNN